MRNKDKTKKDQTICYVQKTHLKCNDIGMLKVKVPKRYNRQTLSQENWNNHINIRQSRFQNNKKNYQGQKEHYVIIK